jgi:phage tail sheath protein FI
MPAALLQPGVYIEEISSGVRTITGVATSIALFIGWAPRGPDDRALRMSSFAEFERNYGGIDGRSLLGYGVRHFYDNGGTDAYIIRIAANDAALASCDIGDLHIKASSKGGWASAYGVMLTRRSDDATRFRLDVVQPANANAVVESFENLSMDSADPRHAPAVINGRSAFIDKLTTGSTNTPTNTTSPVALANGKDGSVIGPADTTSTFRDALLALFGAGAVADRIDLFNLVCVPGLVDAATIKTLQGKCRDRRAFLIVDSPQDETVANMPSFVTTLIGPSPSYAALYYPWVRAPDPLQQGALREFPPCGFVAGIYARTDSARGVWKAPAGIDAGLAGASDLVLAMSDPENGQLNPHAINCLRTLHTYGNVVWGARTLEGDSDRGSEWKYVPVRRMALYLEESLYRGTQWVVFEPNDEPLWAQIRLNIGAFMQDLFRQGAFQGKTPKDAYFVKCDSETTTQTEINLGIVNILVGFAPLKPAEFVVIKIQQIAGDIPT